MSNNIDYDFISVLEGGQHLEGYVPAENQSKSGVTIATGFDLGARDEQDLKKLGFTSTLIDKLKPYLGMKSTDAVNLIRITPLLIKKIEAGVIDKAAKSSITNLLIRKYNAAIKPPQKTFVFLPKEAQTVIASVYYQYGDLSVEAPKFWTAVTSQDWKKSVDILNNFQDRYSTRRKKEAIFLKKVL